MVLGGSGAGAWVAVFVPREQRGVRTQTDQEQGSGETLILLGGAVAVGAGAYLLFRGQSTPSPTSTPSGTGTPTPTPTGTPTPTPSGGPTWDGWWAAASQDDRMAVAVFWTCLQRAPGLPTTPYGTTPPGDPWAAYYSGGCGGTETYWFPNGYTQQNLNVACAAFRFISDVGCEFWNGLGFATTTAQSDICEPVGDCPTIVSAGTSRVLGRSWSTATCGVPPENFGGQPIDEGTAGVMHAVCEPEYQGRIVGLAALATPPWGG